MRRRIDDDRIGAGQAVEEALDLVRPDLHGDVLGDRVPTPGGVPARAAGMDEEQLVASDDDLIDLERRAVVEPFDGDAGQGVLVVVVEHVAQPVGIEHGPARQDAVLAVGDERDLVGPARTIRPRSAERTPPAGDAGIRSIMPGWSPRCR